MGHEQHYISFEHFVEAICSASVQCASARQFRSSLLDKAVPVPLYTLIGFHRVRLNPGKRRTLEWTIMPEMLALVDNNGATRLEPGKVRIIVGGCLPSAWGIALGAPEPASATFSVA
jgi:hypothetical protein